MGKNKRQKLTNKKHSKPQSKTVDPQLKPKPQVKKPKIPTTTTSTDILPPTTKPKSLQHSRPTIPFSPTDTILLIGEGDLSFTSSLITHHAFPSTKLIPTVLEASHSELIEKYPHAEECIKIIEEGGGKVRYGIDVMRLKGKLRELMVRDGREWRGTVDRVVFNFPHVGGKSKDVNRQVRYNQEMLVQFFHSVTPILSPRPGSSIIVTLFEGQPYTLWNIRDLARHSGLQVQQSFRFQAGAYPGYRHARTLGVIKSKRGDGEVSGAAWKGEERASRSYVFVRKGEEDAAEGGKGRSKRKRGDDDSGSDDSDSEDEIEIEDAGGGDSNGDESDLDHDNESDENHELKNEHEDDEDHNDEEEGVENEISS